MGDMAEVFRDMTAIKKQRHSDWHKRNMAVMEKSDIQYDVKNNGEVLIMRLYWKIGNPTVQFWPSTGRWWFKGKTYRGGAKAFLKWYKKQ